MARRTTAGSTLSCIRSRTNRPITPTRTNHSSCAGRPRRSRRTTGAGVASLRQGRARPREFEVRRTRGADHERQRGRPAPRERAGPPGRYCWGGPAPGASVMAVEPFRPVSHHLLLECRTRSWVARTAGPVDEHPPQFTGDLLRPGQSRWRPVVRETLSRLWRQAIPLKRDQWWDFPSPATSEPAPFVVARRFTSPVSAGGRRPPPGGTRLRPPPPIHGLLRQHADRVGRRGDQAQHDAERVGAGSRRGVPAVRSSLRPRRPRRRRRPPRRSPASAGSPRRAAARRTAR